MTEDGLGCSMGVSLTIVSQLFEVLFENQPSVLQFLWIKISSIGPKLIKAALE